MTASEFLDGRAARLLSMAEERVSGERPTVLCMPVGASFGPSGVSDADLAEMARLRRSVSAGDVSSNPFDDKARVWRYMFGVPYSSGPARTVTMGSLPQFQKRNADWDSVLSGLNRVGRPSGEGPFMRPRGEWIRDLASEDVGWRLVEAAHVLAHARAMAARREILDMRFRGFLETLAELVIADRYGLTVRAPGVRDVVDGVRPGPESGFDATGIRPVVSVNARRPWLVAGMSNGGIDLFRDSAAVLVGVHLEPQPWSSREGNPDPNDSSWLEMNRWSCMPSVVALCGWVGMDELSKAPSVSRTAGQDVSSGSFVMPVTAIDGPSSLDAVMSARAPGAQSDDPDAGLWTVGGLLSGGWLETMSMAVQPLPCRECLRLNMSFDGAPSRPASKRPSPDERSPDPKAVREWKEYDGKVDRIVETVRRACDFYDCRFVHVNGGRRRLRDRRRNAKFVSDALRRIGANSKRAASLRTKGFSDRASELDAKSAELMEKVRGMLGNGVH